jgi:hypothetical protein
VLNPGVDPRPAPQKTPIGPAVSPEVLGNHFSSSVAHPDTLHCAGERNTVSDVRMYERAAPSFAATLANRGHHIVYRANASNHCPGCGRSQWYVGRVSAECGFCGTAVPLAEARHDDGGSAKSVKIRSGTDDQRRHQRLQAEGHKLQLLIDGFPTNFALQNISEGGAMVDGPPNLEPGAHVYVRFEGGILVPAAVKWAEDGLVGLAFMTNIMLDRTADTTN